MFALILKFLPIVLGWFGLGAKDQREEERIAGERLGAAKAGQTAAEEELRDIQKASMARGSVHDAPDDILHDPANSGPSGPNVGH